MSIFAEKHLIHNKKCGIITLYNYFDLLCFRLRKEPLMNKLKRPFRLFALISLIPAILGGLLIFLAFYSDYDLTIRHFENSSTLAIASGCAVGLGVLISLAAAILLSKRAKLPRAEDASAAGLFMSVFAGFLIIGNEAVSLMFGDEITVIGVIIGIFALLSGIYMMLSHLPATASTPAVGLLSMAPTLWLGFSLISTYRVTDTALNDPFSTYYALELISLMLFFTFAAGAALRPDTRGGFYTFSAYLLLTVGGEVMLSRLILSLVQKSVFDVSVLESIMFLALYVYAFLQVLSLDRRGKADTEAVYEAAPNEAAKTLADSGTDNNTDAESDPVKGESDGAESDK
jgi:hypothetical protein